MIPTDREDTVLATVESGETYPIRVVRRRLPRGTGQLSGIFTCSPGWAPSSSTTSVCAATVAPVCDSGRRAVTWGISRAPSLPTGGSTMNCGCTRCY